MKKLLTHMKGYIKESIISPLFKLFEACFELLIPLLVANIIDIGIAHKDKPYVVKMCIIMAILGFVGLGCALVAQYYAAKASVGFATKVKHSLFSHIQTLSYSEIDTLGTSTLITRMTSDMNQVQNGVNLTLRLFLRSPLIVFGAMIMAFTVDIKSALVFVVAIPVLSLVVFGIMLATIPLYKKVQSRLDKVLGVTRENLQGVRVIRAFGQEKEEEEKFKISTANLNTAQKFVGRISALMNPMTYVILNIGISVLIWNGAIQVNLGELSQGEVIALYNYMSQILVELIKLANLIISITKAVACGNRVQSVFEISSSITAPDSMPQEMDTQYSVEFDNATLKYISSNEPSLENIDFKVKKGQTVGIIGGTGSGKSSLVNLIGRFYDVCNGEVKVNGVNVKEYPLEYLRDKIGIVPQKAVLFRGSIRDNMKWGNKNADDDAIYKAIEQAQASDVLASKPDGLDSYIEQGGKNLSGGQRQRFTIARALVKKPEILILDDSASALDYATDAALRSSISKIEYNPTVFIVSQRTASIMHADLIVVLDDGKIVGMGKHDELLNSCLVYSEIYSSQFRKEGV
ncbi:MAG: ABC transporter ATP-binding protein [Clostridia bacterium]|nr:ABC transporter ATP-binding protein [Clostridia bacterium]